MGFGQVGICYVTCYGIRSFGQFCQGCMVSTGHQRCVSVHALAMWMYETSTPVPDWMVGLVQDLTQKLVFRGKQSDRDAAFKGLAATIKSEDFAVKSSFVTVAAMILKDPSHLVTVFFIFFLCFFVLIMIYIYLILYNFIIYLFVIIFLS